MTLLFLFEFMVARLVCTLDHVCLSNNLVPASQVSFFLQQYFFFLVASRHQDILAKIFDITVIDLISDEAK